MDYILSLIPRLGLTGAIFILFMLVAQLGLTQFAKDITRAIFKRRHRPEGCSDDDWAEQQYAVKTWMIWLMSLLIGAGLGGLILSPVARLLELRQPEPYGGMLAGLLLAAITSGLESFYQQRTEEKGQAASAGIAAVLAQMQAAQARQLPAPTPGSSTLAPPATGERPPVDIVVEPDPSVQPGFQPDPTATHFNLVAPEWMSELPDDPPLAPDR